jgi:hypothetical protein
VAFLGALHGDALEAEYAAADIFALATHYEGYGMAAAEAQARGLPLAICTGGAIAEVVGPGAAILAPPGDFNSLSRGLRRVIMDPELRAQMAEASWRAGSRCPAGRTAPGASWPSWRRRPWLRPSRPTGWRCASPSMPRRGTRAWPGCWPRACRPSGRICSTSAPAPAA